MKYYFNGNMECAVKDKVSTLIRENFKSLALETYDPFDGSNEIRHSN